MKAIKILIFQFIFFSIVLSTMDVQADKQTPKYIGKWRFVKHVGEPVFKQRFEEIQKYKVLILTKKKFKFLKITRLNPAYLKEILDIKSSYQEYKDFCYVCTSYWIGYGMERKVIERVVVNPDNLGFSFEKLFKNKLVYHYSGIIYFFERIE